MKQQNKKYSGKDENKKTVFNISGTLNTAVELHGCREGIHKPSVPVIPAITDFAFSLSPIALPMES